MTTTRVLPLRAALLATLLAPCVGAAQTPTAEPWFRGGTWMFTAEIGGAAFTDFQRARARPAAGTHGVPDFQRRVSAATTFTAGAAATYWAGDGWGVRVAGAYTPTRFSVQNEAHAQRILDELDGDTPRYAKLGTWSASGTGVFRLPLGLGRLVPYGMAGVGAVQHRVVDDEEVPPEARERFADGGWTGAAAVFGVGSVIPLQRKNMLLTFELTNHLTRTPLDDAGLGGWFDIGGVPLQLDEDPQRGGDGISLTSSLRLTVGLTLPLRF
jgi:hypothetical protein